MWWGCPAPAAALRVVWGGQGWEELMLVLESSLAGGRREVALAAMSLLVSIMQTHGTSALMKRSMWRRALRAVGVGAEAAASPQCMVPLQARLELVTSIGLLHVSPPLRAFAGLLRACSTTRCGADLGAACAGSLGCCAGA